MSCSTVHARQRQQVTLTEVSRLGDGLVVLRHERGESLARKRKPKRRKRKTRRSKRKTRRRKKQEEKGAEKEEGGGWSRRRTGGGEWVEEEISVAKLRLLGITLMANLRFFRRLLLCGSSSASRWRQARSNEFKSFCTRENQEGQEREETSMYDMIS